MKKKFRISVITVLIAALTLTSACPESEDDPDTDGGINSDTSADTGSDLNKTCASWEPLTEDVTSNTTLDGCYLVKEIISVGGEALLTIVAGSVLKFEQDTGLEINYNGALKAEGTADRPVLFTGDQQVPGSWRGILFHDSTSPDNRLDHVTVEYGGGYDFAYGEPANVALTSSGTLVRASLTNSTLQHSGGYGFFFDNEAQLDTFASNTLSFNASGAGYVVGDAAGQLDNASAYSGNTKDIVLIEADGLNVDQTWPAIDVPYEIDGTILIDEAPGVTLTIEAGATLTFQKGGGLDVGQDGALVARGTASKPITFTRAGDSGHWRGILFHNSASKENELDHVTVEYGGSYNFAQGEPANVALTSSGYAVRLRLTNSTLRHSAGYGFYISHMATLAAFADNTITANASGAGYVVGDAAGQIDSSSTYLGNDNDWVWLEADGLNVDQTWPAIDVPYQVDGTILVDEAPGVTLTLEAGVTLRFRQGSGIDVGEDGALVAKGTGSKPITLTRAATGGDWRGLLFHNADSADNTLDHVTVEYGGGYNFAYGDNANIAVTSSGFPVQLTLTNSTIRSSSGFGVWVSRDATFSESDNTFANNASSPDVYYEQ